MFKNVSSFEDLKKEYRKLAKLHHPDTGGKEEDFKKLNEAYENKTKELLESKTEQEKKEGFKETAETMADFKKITDELLQYDNIFLEICGLWLWISGDTKPIKDKLKALGCFYASKKCQWYYRPTEYKSSNKKPKTMDYIREKYGSNFIYKNSNTRIECQGV